MQIAIPKDYFREQFEILERAESGPAIVWQLT